MILVDTSIWINHLRDSNPQLEKLLLDAKVLCHTHVIGELACGSIKNRKEILSLLQVLPRASTIQFEEYMYYIDKYKLQNKGLGFVDIHLLAAAQLDQAMLWTADKKLTQAAGKLGLKYS